MKILTKSLRVHGVVAALLLGVTGTPTQAATITQQLFESTTLVTSTSMNGTEFNLSMPGLLVIELNDLKWPTALGSLSFSLNDGTHVLKTFIADDIAGTNSWTFDVTTAGTLYGSIFAKPADGAKAGLYYANISYQSVAPVPLPGAAWLLLSGIAGLTAFRPRYQLSQSPA